jgi:hypothetical protein
MKTNVSLYDRDFYAWTAEQAALLRTGRLAEADIENIIEEIESLGRSEKRELRSRLAVLLAHLLKWYAQPDSPDRRGWRATIDEQRVQLLRHLTENPSLADDRLHEVAADAWRVALIRAAGDLGIAKALLPASCPWPITDALDEGFWPESEERR